MCYTKIMDKLNDSLLIQPKSSRRAAKVIQPIPMSERDSFIEALKNATTVEDLPEPYKGYMKHGYKP